MSKSYRFDRDDDGEGFQSRKQMKKARKQNKFNRDEISRRQEVFEGDEENGFA